MIVRPDVTSVSITYQLPEHYMSDDNVTEMTMTWEDTIADAITSWLTSYSYIHNPKATLVSTLLHPVRPGVRTIALSNVINSADELSFDRVALSHYLGRVMPYDSNPQIEVTTEPWYPEWYD